MNQVVLNMPLIDWVTLSFSGEPIRAVRKYAQDRRGEGKPAKRKMNKSWYTGFNGDGFFYGEGEQVGARWGIFMSEGEISHHYANEIWGMALGSKLDCTRIDYQITIQEPSYYNAYRFRSSLQRLMGRECSTTGKHSLGITVEMNSRQSTRYARIYEKVLMDGKKETGRLLRMEFEYKGQLASDIWKKPLKPAAMLRSEVEGIVHGKSLASRVVGEFWPFLGDVSERVAIVRKQSNTWNWIDSTVRASFEKIINAHDVFERAALKQFCQEFVDVIEVKEGLNDDNKD